MSVETQNVSGHLGEMELMGSSDRENTAIAGAICLAFAGAALAQNTSTPPQINYSVPKVRSVIPTATPVLQPFEPPPFNWEFAYPNPRPYAFADFNGDGLLDIITAPSFHVSLPYLPIEIWLNKGDGTFYNGTSQVIDGPVPVTAGPNTMLIGDFNEDGRPDVMMIDTGFDPAVAHHYPIQNQGFHETLLLSQPNGKWRDGTSQITPNTQAFNHQGGMGDVNGDGHLDFVVNRGGTDNLVNWMGVVLLIGDGKGNFVEHTDGLPQDIAWGPWDGFKGLAPDLQIISSAGLGDLDGDGRADLITCSGGGVAGGGMSSPRSIRFYQSKSDGSFVERSRTGVPAAIAGIGEATPDAQSEGIGLSCSQVLVADLNSDGRPDIVTFWEGYHTSVVILRNDGDFHFTDITPQAMGGYTMDFKRATGPGTNAPGHFALIDVNGDGTLDLVSKIAADDLASVLTHTAFLNDGNAHFTPWVPRGPNGPLTANDILPVITTNGVPCTTCSQMPMMFDTNRSGLPSLVMLDGYSSQTTTRPLESTSVYLTNVTPTTVAPSYPPLLTSVLPGSLPRGQQYLSLTIAGRFTHFSKSSVVTFSGTGISAGAPASVTATSLTLPVTISANAPLGVQGIQVTTGTETVSLAGVFAVSPGPPLGIISSITVANGGSEIAQNAWMVIQGKNLVPANVPAGGVIWSDAPEFASGHLPTQLGGYPVSVTVNNKPAYLYFFCSAAGSVCATDQINVLTPLDDAVGPVPVVVTTNGVKTAAFNVNLRAAAPSFPLVAGTKYVVATHGDNSLVGPESLSVPGYPFTPARPGETIVLYGFGFGLPISALVAGSSSQSGSLSGVPVVQIGGAQATVTFAGVIGPGLYQLNVVVPGTAKNGDNSLTCSYRTSNAATSPVGDLITIQP